MLISRILLVLLGFVAAAVLGAGVGSSMGQRGSESDVDILAATGAVASSTATQVPTTTTSEVTTTTATQVPTTTTSEVTTTTTTQVRSATTTQAPTTTTTQAPAGSFNAAHESQFLALINGLRSTPLLSGPSLKVHARNWARYMAETEKLSHSSLGSLLDPWSTVGENVAFGHSVVSMFEALSASSAHRANMVNESFTHVGIGVWIDADGRTWTAHVFGG